MSTARTTAAVLALLVLAAGLRAQIDDLGHTQAAAEQGHAAAQFSLGLQYDNGDGVPQDYREAAHWYGRPPSKDITGLSSTWATCTPRVRACPRITNKL